MAFRLREDESVAKGLSRVVRKELRSAVDRLTSGSSNEAIHDARKRIKKVRAVLQLVGDGFASERALKQLRRASHLLSPLRDMDAMIEIAGSLRREGDTDSAHLAAAIGTQLKTDKARLHAAAGRDQVRVEAARALKRVRRDARRWRWKDIDSQVLAKAVKRSYKRARNRMQDARVEQQPDTFHEWRKRVKTLWYGLRLIESRAPRLRRPIADFKRLETWLGDDHNLVVLEKHFGSPKAERIGTRTHAHLRALIGQRQRELRRQALAIGARLFAHSPKAFAQRLRDTRDTHKRPQRSTAAA